MARNEITPIELSMNAQSDTLKAAEDVTSDTGAFIDVSGLDGSKLLLIAVTTSTAKDIEAVVKDGGTYSGGEVGDLTITSTGQGIQYFIGPFETARFKDSDGYIKIDGTTEGEDKAFELQAILLP